MHIFLIRHGESVSNAGENFISRIPDHLVPLTEKGKEVAKRIGDIAIEIQRLADHGIDEAELVQFYATLEKISGNLINIAEEEK